MAFILSLAFAMDLFYKLLDKKDLSTAEFPGVETGIMDGDISFRQHRAGHTPTPNRLTFLDFAARYFNKGAASSKEKGLTIR